MEITVKNMHSGHIPSVLAIEREAFPSPWSEKLFLQELAAVHSQSYVAVTHPALLEEVVGYICAWVVHDECVINKIACHAACRRSGVGRQLLQHLTYSAYQRGASFFSLEARESNTAAQLLYKKMGFVQAGIRKDYYPETGENAIVMVLSLDGLLAGDPDRGLPTV